MSGKKRKGQRRRRVPPIERELESAMLGLLSGRGRGEGLSVEEAALAVGGESWRRLVRRAGRVAQRLADAGLLEFVPAGRFVGPRWEAAPLRLRLTSEGAAGARVLSRMN